MIDAIYRDVEEHGPIALTVTLGDYIDRGPASRGVLDRLIGNPFPTPFVALKGNHEALLEAFLANPAVGKHWRSLGGPETLYSYGVPVGTLMVGKDCAEAADRLRAALPAEHLSFLQSLKTSLSHGKYFLCHAGVRPGVPLESQQEEDLLWIRDEFLNSKMDFGKIVVHGHTPRPEPEVLPNRDQYRYWSVRHRATIVCCAGERPPPVPCHLTRSQVSGASQKAWRMPPAKITTAAPHPKR